MTLPIPLPTLLQRKSCLVPFISARIFIIPKLQNIYWRRFFSTNTLGELFSLSIEHLPNCYSVRPSPFYHYRCFIIPVWNIWKHLSHAFPTEMIFYVLRSIPSDRLIHVYSAELVLEIIFNWLQVSVSDCNRQTLFIKILICV